MIIIKLIVLEGARGSGKSGAAKLLRETLPASTLINFTGFKDDGVDGFYKVKHYYNSWYKFFEALSQNDDEDYVFICDRIFISEMVYASIYKNYNFSDSFKGLLFNLLMLNVQVDLFHITVAESELPQRLKRDKNDDWAKLGESVEQVMRQQLTYKGVIDFIQDFAGGFNFNNISIHNIDTTHLEPVDVAEQIISKLH